MPAFLECVARQLGHRTRARPRGRGRPQRLDRRVSDGHRRGNVRALGGGSRSLPERVSALRRAQNVERLILGVDRLDYTKGIPRKLLAMERLLERSPQHRGKVRLLIAVPSRENVAEYKSLRADVEGLVGRINGSSGSLHDAPIHYLYQPIAQAELVASYRAAEIMLVTPLRDGMNLVAKEYVASRIDGDGVLVLSELAGAASELGEALTVNPYDVESLALTLDRALSMPETERRERMAALRDKVRARPVELWAQQFVSALESDERTPEPRDLRANSADLDVLARDFATRQAVLLALDYDGTLVKITSNPERARPDASLRELLVVARASAGRRSVHRQWSNPILAGRLVRRSADPFGCRTRRVVEASRRARLGMSHRSRHARLAG